MQMRSSLRDYLIIAGTMLGIVGLIWFAAEHQWVRYIFQDDGRLAAGR